MNVTVRYIRESDIAGYQAALGAVVRERKFLLTLDPPSLDNVSKFVQKNIQNNHAQYVAEVAGEIVGWADVLPYDKEALQHAGLLGMGVVAEHRSKGIGQELLRHVIEHSWRIGLKRIELEVFASNLAAVALYEKFGFLHEGTKRNGRYFDGAFNDVHCMAQCRIL